ncbi:MAG: hypothetical protein R3B13_31770 [Polyangiaceae bacterium]
MSHIEEYDRPTEWLRRLREDRALYRRLLSDAGSLARAAYRLARARCRVQPVSVGIPTLAELRVAADEIAGATGLADTGHPADLIRECEDAGFTLILPLSVRAA